MAFHAAHLSNPAATFDGFFQGATLDEIWDYFTKPPVEWEPVDLCASAKTLRTLIQHQLTKAAQSNSAAVPQSPT